MLRASVWLVAMLSGLLVPHQGKAACNIIPAAERTYISTLGAVVSPITTPGRTVRVRLRPGCDTSPGFDTGTPANNIVTITFQPPVGPPTDVVVGGVVVDSATSLRFVVPDTDAVLAPPGDGLGLAGPARIRIKNPSNTLLAEIGPLYVPTATCDRVPDQVFRQFTILPPANVSADLASGASSRILATLDGDSNVLIPLQHLAILPSGDGAPIARLLEGETTLEAFTGGGVPIQIPASDYVRSFTLDGRPLPPLMRVNASGDLLFGTADAAESVIRIARTDGVAPDIYDLTDRLYLGRGPIVIDRTLDGFTVTTREPVPLRGLRSSGQTVAFVRDEGLEGDLNIDGDHIDRLVQLIDVQSGSSSATNLAIVEVSRAGFSSLALETTGTVAAFLESEAAGGHTDLNGDGDAFDSILRVFTGAGANLAPLSIGADPAPVVNDRSLVVSNGLVFFRSREGDDFPRVTERVNLSNTSQEANGASGGPVISADGRFVAFPSLAYNLIAGTNGASLCLGGTPNGVPQGAEQCDDGNAVNGDGCDSGCHLEPPRVHILVYDRDLDTIERVSVSAAGELGNGDSTDPSISADGRYVAFASLASNLVAGDSNGVADVFVYDRATDTIARASVSSAGTGGNGQSTVPAISGDGRFVVFSSAANNLLVAGDTNGRFDIFMRDRATNTTTRVSLGSGGGQANDDAFDSAVSGDGRYVSFASGATNLVPGDTNGRIDVFVRDRILGTTERVSVPSAGGQTDDDSIDTSISADGKLVAFNSFATNLVPGDANGSEDVFVFDRERQVVEQVSLNDGGEEGNSSSLLPIIGSDGRFVAFQSYATNLVPLDTNGSPDVFVYDRDTNTIERVSVDALNNQANGLSTLPALSTDGRHTVFVSGATNLVGPGIDQNAVDDVFVRGIGSGASLNADGDIADNVLQVFDTGGAALRPSARAAATEIAVADGRALIVTSEADEGVADLNDDGDALDGVAELYDGLTDTRDELRQAARAIAISADLAVMTVPEEEQDGDDLNGDGDAFDEVLAVQSIGAPPAVRNIGVAADAVAVIGKTVVFATPEESEDVSDLNGDGDANDRVLRIYDDDVGHVTEVGVAVDDFVVGGSLVALRTPEAAEGRDLNGDGDTLDLVMQVYDLETDSLLSTGQAAMPCTLPGCEPFTPYKIKNNTVSFLVREADQGNTDLNGDGDALDVVMQVFNPRTGITQVFDQSAGAPDLTPLPEEIIEAPILYVQASEAVAGADLNGDGDQDDVVVLLGSDADDDEAFDDFDTCVETSNPEQDDSDLDGLGDICDPTAFCSDYVPPSASVPVAGAQGCQAAVRKAAATYLKSRANATRTCLAGMANGKLTGDASGVCRGSFGVGGIDVLPKDAKTAKKLAAAAAKLRKAVAKGCSPVAASQLDACGATPDALASCVIAAYGASANGASRGAYGNVQAIGDSVALACQSAAGKASAAYLVSLIKAQHQCLGHFAEGDLVGDPRVLCLGSIAGGSLVLPTDQSTGSKIATAGEKLSSALATVCPGATLAGLDGCGDDPTSAKNCLVCTAWRRAVEAVRSVHGPQ